MLSWTISAAPPLTRRQVAVVLGVLGFLNFEFWLIANELFRVYRWRIEERDGGGVTGIGQGSGKSRNCEELCRLVPLPSLPLYLGMYTKFRDSFLWNLEMSLWGCVMNWG